MFNGQTAQQEIVYEGVSGPVYFDSQPGRDRCNKVHVCDQCHRVAPRVGSEWHTALGRVFGDPSRLRQSPAPAAVGLHYLNDALVD